MRRNQPSYAVLCGAILYTFCAYAYLGLIQSGLLYRTQKGRMVSRLGYAHMGIPYPFGDEEDNSEDNDDQLTLL